LDQKIIHNGNLKSPLNIESLKISFNLIGYRNDLFTSDNPEDIIEFYNTFKSKESLIKWMKERPKGVTYINEVDGRKDIIVVIPTANVNGKYAKACRDEIFKGLHIIFVESGEVKDPYFNVAHASNVGFKKALEYDPKWIIFSNDDMYKIDDVSVLIEELNKINPATVDVVFADSYPCFHHSYERVLGTKRSIYDFASSFYHLFLNKQNKPKTVYKMKKINKTFNTKLLIRNRYSKIVFKKARKFIEIGDFAIFSGIWVRNMKGNIFDETYINAHDDLDLSYVLSKSNKDYYKIIKYQIGSFSGTSLGLGITRDLRRIAADVYLESKFLGDFA